ncbi:MAG: two-component system, NtrC family, sensor kinase [Hyphomicrobiales bacterium]|nr:two-component system, NtrC family, sensor kinase [Hyphomicrobiales bacterium]
MSRHGLIPFLKVLLVAAVVVPAALFVFFAWHSYSAAIHTAHEQADRFAAIVREHALKVFETIGLTLESVDHRLQGASWDEIRTSRPLWQQIRQIQQRTPQVGAIFVSPPDGNVGLTTRVFPAPPTDFSDRHYFRVQQEQNRGFYIGKAYVGRISGESIFNFSVRKSSADGRFNGIIGISAYVSYFEDFYRGIGLEADNFAIALMREDGQVLVRYPAAPRPFAVPATSEFLGDMRKAEKGTFTALSPVDGKTRIAGYAKVGPYPVYASYGIDKGALVSAWLKGIIPEAIITFLAGLALSLLCWFALRSAQKQQSFALALDDTNRRLEFEMAARARAEASLLQAQRLEAMGQLTGGIAHDFNNLLMVISGNVELAERRWNDPNAIKRKLKSIRYATERAKALTQQLLAFARRHTPDAKTVDLNDALEKARTLVTYSLPESVKLTFELSVETCPVRIDVSEFEAGILNLVGNARDAMPNGGTLTISTRLAPGTASGGGTEQQVELCIKDTGHGMSPETVQRVFEPFFTTKERGKGTGLGLSQVYGFVQQSGGSINVQSELGGGTTIIISFPRSADKPLEVETVRASRGRQENALTILVVEDQREVRQVSAAMLEDLGHQVLLARNSAEALALLHAGYPIELLFADVTLGDGLSGVDLALQAVSEFPRLKVVLTTGHPARADLLKQNDFAVLAKPYTRDGLAAALQSSFQADTIVRSLTFMR